MKTRILLADDHTIFRQALRTLLEKEIGAEIVAEAENGQEAIEETAKLNPDLVILDITMPRMNGIEAARAIMERQPHIKILALSMHSDQQLVLKMLQAGAKAYLEKDCGSDELLEAIHTVLSNRMFVSPRLRIPELDAIVASGEPADSISPVLLTAKEREVLQLVAEGKPTKQIAILLGVSMKTIDKHRQRIMEKLDLHSVAELTKYAVREGLTSIEK